MKTAIVGASSAGLYLAIFLKKKHPDYDVFLIDKNEKVGRKLMATGNGHCNILNKTTSPADFNYPLFMKPILEHYNFDVLENALKDIGVSLMEEGDYVYPASFSAPSHVAFLEKLCLSLDVKILLKREVVDYICEDDGTVKLIYKDDKPELFDKVVFATGGASGKNLGTDGSFFTTFFSHGYEVTPLKPSLCPIVTKEDTKTLAGLRHDVKATLCVDGRILHIEKGEVLFKKDGLSGIVIFNCESFIAHLDGEHEVEISLDLEPEISLADLVLKLEDLQAKAPGFFLSSLFQKPLADYLCKKAGIDASKQLDKRSLFSLAKIIKDLIFHFKTAASFSDSIVTAGGVKLNFVDDSLSSTIEKNVSFIGEVLDIDGLCGGHNLTWCLISSLIVASSL